MRTECPLWLRNNGRQGTRWLVERLLVSQQRQKSQPTRLPKTNPRALQMVPSAEGVCKSSAITVAPRTESADEFLGPIPVPKVLVISSP